jgi:DNA modification methylase
MLNQKLLCQTEKADTNLNKDYSKIYKLHKYWSRKPWYPIYECINEYSKPGDNVLDMFLGSGVTALESLILGRKFIGFDLNPMSIFISENTVVNNFDEKVFLSEIEVIKDKLLPLVKRLYAVNETCLLCGNNLIIEHINIGPKFKDKETVNVYCINCGKNTKVIRNATREEVEKVNFKGKINKWYPKNRFPDKFYKDRFSYKGVKQVSDIYTSRNLFFLSELLNIIKTSNLKYKELFILAFSNTVLHASKLKAENVRPLNVNNYWIPDDYFEENPWLRFLERTNLIYESRMMLKKRIGNRALKDYKFYNKSSLSTGLDSNSIDYIITDPPYGDAVQYSELSFIWNSWMNYVYEIEEEVIINPVQNKGIGEFLDLLEKSVSEAYRILKPGKRYTLCFHNKEFKIWNGVLNIFKKHDFILEDVKVINTHGNSYNKNWAKFSPKTDLYLTFIKGKYMPTHNKEISIQEILKRILSNYSGSDLSIIYDKLSVELINETYFNEYKIDLSKLTTKNIVKIMGIGKNGN